MKKITFYLCFLLIPTILVSQNLIENGNAEITPFTENGWTQISGNWQQRTVSPLPQNGEAYFFAGANSSAELFQEVDVSNNSVNIDAGNQTYTFTCYLHSWAQSPADEGRVIVNYNDSTGEILDTYDTGINTTTEQWVLFTDARLAPVGTRTIKITLLSVRNNGSNNDGYIDNIELIEGEPLSIEHYSKSDLFVFPNPSKTEIQISGLTDNLSYEIYNLLGMKIVTGTVSKNEHINIESLNEGIYLLKLNTKVLKFIKK